MVLLKLVWRRIFWLRYRDTLRFNSLKVPRDWENGSKYNPR